MSINATLLGQMITFVLFVWFVMRYVWPPIEQAIKDRQDTIADGLAAAERGHHDLALAKDSAAKQLKQTKEQAAKIIEDAKKQANHIIDSAKEQARAEGHRLLEGAQSEIEQMVNQSKEALRGEVAKVALLGAERVLEKSIDESAHSELLEQLASRI